jgi:hypothetical protein
MEERDRILVFFYRLERAYLSEEGRAWQGATIARVQCGSGDAPRWRGREGGSSLVDGEVTHPANCAAGIRHFVLSWEILPIFW